ncbi:MAG: NADH-quinone oxidoreductase subunit F [Verrucomicrobia bacterium GWC2_42_7]|nr:MAG: NADH-quinone oxidoreductase subunit F [Verrucomicrobia bacterium GWC2_42_7]
MAIVERRVLLKHVDEPGYVTGLECYLNHEGYEVLKKSLLRKPEELRQEVVNSGVRGRGGAGFPTGVKWNFLKKSDKPIFLICNADESEPGTFKDRQIIHKDPHQLIEGIMLAAYAIQAKQAFIYIRGEMAEGADLLESAIREAKNKQFVGQNICGSSYSCDITVHRGAGCYICGEETGLIESLEGKRGYPRIKPPYFPANLGLYGCPTIVNNVETLCQVKHILDVGGKEYAKIGTPNNTGTRIWCVSGMVKKPGYYEFPCGSLTLGELIFDVCGGMFSGRNLKAVIPGGLSSKILKAGEIFRGSLKDGTPFEWSLTDIPLDYDSLTAVGSMSGSGGIIVLDNSVDMLRVIANICDFYAHESCGQCTPCREGSLWLKKITARMLNGQIFNTDPDLLLSIANQIEGKTICAHGEGIAWPVQSLVSKFKDEFLGETLLIPQKRLPQAPSEKEILARL